MIIGTAGHIDHGKTTLVRALTGVDTDRLPQEKARGISIELGYAYVPLANGDVLGFVDVPGHEKFVHTMAAGATGIDGGLLAVAADDGVMPQTREHLAILHLLGVAPSAVAMTKADRADAAQRARVLGEIAALCAEFGWAGTPVFEVSATDPADAGTARLRAHLLAQAESAPAARSQQALFRLAVDRVFTLPGQGTVVTGTVHGGVVRSGDMLAHSATGQAVRVRAIHAQNRASEHGVAGQRCALQLAGIAREQITRGDWIADARALAPSQRLDVRLRLLPDAPALATWTPVHAHLGTAHHVAHTVLLEGEHLAPGQSARVQLVFDAPVFAAAGDRLVLRNAQASQTIAGATVIDPHGVDRKRRSPARLEHLQRLEALALHRDAAALQAWLDTARHGVPLTQLERLLARPAQALPLDDTWVRVPLPGTPADTLLLTPARWQALRCELLAALDRFHTQHPDEPGADSARLRRMTWPGGMQAGHDALWRGLIEGLVHDGAIAATGAWLHRPDHRVQLSTDEETLAQQLRPALIHGGYDPPWVRDLARDHAVPESQVRQLLRKLARQGELYQVVPDLFYAAPHIEALARIAANLADAAPGGAQAKDFRDATGLGRKRAIQVLEFFDRIGHLRRLRNAHVVRPGSRWAPELAPDKNADV
ncbi:MAG: Selenocysteine-specific elongation factor [Paracidovorax wautersii]|uniref:Selenocysteine-specific elongation factor n=1 Tax=Paracidovorax wautersii TaxID=1177982 RepID=A0A7V8FRY3_9BURK|nr:MAG: Selenocysteine-specific elongation factor [Paracidovorax wautersii]